MTDKIARKLLKIIDRLMDEHFFQTNALQQLGWCAHYMLDRSLKYCKDVDINTLSDNVLKNLQPADNRNLQNVIDDDFIPIDDRTQQERDDDNISLAGEAPAIINIDTTSAWDQNKTEVARPGPIIKLSTDFDKKVRAAK